MNPTAIDAHLGTVVTVTLDANAARPYAGPVNPKATTVTGVLHRVGASGPFHAGDPSSPLEAEVMIYAVTPKRGRVRNVSHRIVSDVVPA